MGASRQVPNDHPLMQDWNTYKSTEEFANSKKWARVQPSDPTKQQLPSGANLLTEEMCEQHTEGALWSAFMRRWLARGGDEYLPAGRTQLSGEKK